MDDGSTGHLTDILGKIADNSLFGAGNIPFVRFFLTCYQTKDGGFAGAITAALFLQRFVTQTQKFVHFDCYGWQPSAAPARPKGGEMQGARAMLAAIEAYLE